MCLTIVRRQSKNATDRSSIWKCKVIIGEKRKKEKKTFLKGGKNQ